LILGVTLLSLTLILACGQQEEPIKVQKPAPASKLLVFNCEGGKGFTVEFDDKDENALLTLNDKTLKLPHVPSGSGAKYSNGKTTFWTKGEKSFVEVDGKIILRDCKVKK
jgi:membrane-bound inhibitor of C-type lysozyme